MTWFLPLSLVLNLLNATPDPNATDTIHRLAGHHDLSSLQKLADLELDPDFAVCTAAAEAFDKGCEVAIKEKMKKVDEAPSRADIDKIFEEITPYQELYSQTKGGKWRGRLLREARSHSIAVRENLICDIAASEHLSEYESEVEDYWPWGFCCISDDEYAFRVALGSAGDAAVALLKREDIKFKASLINDLPEPLPEGDVACVLQIAETTRGNIQWQAVAALAGTNDPRVDQFLLRVSADRDKNLRLASVRGLDQSQSPEAVRALCRLSLDRNEDVQNAAVGSLRENSDPEIPITARKLLTDPRPSSRIHGCGLIQNLRLEGFVDDLKRLLSDKNQDVLDAAQRAIDAFPPPP